MKRVLHIYHTNFYLRLVFSIILVILSSFLLAYSIGTFVQSHHLLSAGFSGLSILISRMGELFGVKLDISYIILALNIPVALLCSRSISLRFTLLSCLQFFLTSFFLGVLKFQVLFDDIILNCLLGGVVYGSSISLALKAEASSGGTDFIALYVSNKIGKGIWQYVFMFNCLMLIVFGFLFGWQYAGYSILFQYVSTRVVERFHNRFSQVTLQITTSMPDLVLKTYLNQFHHGCTVSPSYGAYSHTPLYLCTTVVSSYEVADIVACLKTYDKNCIINVLKTERFYGGFYRKPIE